MARNEELSRILLARTDFYRENENEMDVTGSPVKPKHRGTISAARLLLSSLLIRAGIAFSLIRKVGKLETTVAGSFKTLTKAEGEQARKKILLANNEKKS